MKKFILVFLMLVSSIANALPLPVVAYDVQPGGGLVTAMRAQAELQNQYLQNQMLREKILMMRQERASMEMQPEDISAQAIYSIKKIIHCLENNSIGQSTYWKDSRDGASYTATPIRNITYAANQYCREYQIIIKGKEGRLQQNNLACRRSNGTWFPVSNH